ncbi:hypothetical protein EYZ11_010176 [Aspergillus tanneri]|uniref:Uncharacterized protein n=1 Tax=Aspergillus tanneri TaxID=1220188 RepID=A0A4S3J6H5_9EURO|nr:uncharacterized protein ATNIH1004_003772 [Aspergillus tanneri]KAA8651079.1 hypothetical protein ATNIH1004_003772 [Aspergillus tanneri]THC90352.1 hypothetical protein EYZ11_010176 [Aspergillus tanneri]
MPCPCPHHIQSLLSLLPQKSQPTFLFSLIPSLTQPLHDASQSIESCKHPHPTLVSSIVLLSEFTLSLCQSACVAYNLTDQDTPQPLAAATPPSSRSNAGCSPTTASWTCTKTLMALGQLTLDDEEEGLLARRIVYTVLTNLSALLRTVYLREGQDTSTPTRAGNGNANANAIATAAINGLFDLDPVAASSVPQTAALYGREADGPVSGTLSRVLALLGKLFSE